MNQNATLETIEALEEELRQAMLNSNIAILIES
jgi:hypothetical protein